jgi:hypothetical protein
VQIEAQRGGESISRQHQLAPDAIAKEATPAQKATTDVQVRPIDPPPVAGPTKSWGRYRADIVFGSQQSPEHEASCSLTLVDSSGVDLFDQSLSADVDVSASMIGSYIVTFVHVRPRKSCNRISE